MSAAFRVIINHGRLLENKHCAKTNPYKTCRSFCQKDSVEIRMYKKSESNKFKLVTL